jgi:hypothetical protein
MNWYEYNGGSSADKPVEYYWKFRSRYHTSSIEILGETRFAIVELARPINALETALEIFTALDPEYLPYNLI